MTSPNIPHRVEVELEIAAPVEEVWRAIATAEGISSWMMPTDLDHERNELVFHMGPEFDSRGTITSFDPPHRVTYEEDWAALTGHDSADVTPLVTEFLVEARSGGTCTVRVVTSAFGTGAEWENEFFEEMADGWLPMLDNLRLYVETFPGQTATTVWIESRGAGAPDGLLDEVRRRLGVAGVGDPTTERGLDAVVERSIARHLLLRVSAPVQGFMSFTAAGGDGQTMMGFIGYLFGDAATTYAATERAAWQAWLDDVAASASPSDTTNRAATS